MSKASIVPYQAGALGLVIADGDTNHQRLLYCESILVGRIVALEVPENGKSMRRELSQESLIAICTRVVQSCQTHGVQVAHVEAPSKQHEFASRIFNAIVDSIELAGIEYVTSYSAWRYRFGEPQEYRPKARALIERLFQTSEWAKYDSLVYAGALLCHQALLEVEPPPARTRNLPGVGRAIGAEVNKVPPSPVTMVNDSAHSDSLEIELSASLERIATANDAPVSDTTERALEPAPADAEGTIRAGLDSGSHFIGLVIASGDRAPLRAHVIRTLQGGDWVPLPRPRVVEYADGSKHTITQKWMFTFEDALSVADRVVTELIAHRVISLTVEFSDQLHVQHGAGEAAQFIGTELIRASWIWVLVYERATRAGIRVRRVRAATWRAKVAGRARKHRGEAELIPAAVRAGFANWPGPRVTNDHERDAGGIVLYDLLMDDEERLDAIRPAVEQALSDSKPKRKRSSATSTSNSNRKKRSAEARAAAGCTCPGKNHRQGCKLYKRKAPEMPADALDLTAPLKHEKEAPPAKGYRIVMRSGRYYAGMRVSGPITQILQTTSKSQAIVFESYKAARTELKSHVEFGKQPGQVEFPNGTLRS